MLLPASLWAQLPGKEQLPEKEQQAEQEQQAEKKSQAKQEQPAEGAQQTAGTHQTDSLLYLREVRVEALRIKSRTGFEETRIDSATIQRYENTNLGQLLQQQSSLFIRSYGVSGQSTPSIRGTGASHTQIYWNGLLINSPTLGQVDLTTLPVAISDEITINYGGASLLDGCGGLGGSISISSHTHARQLRLNIQGNSMQNLGGNLLYAYGKNRLKGSTRLVWLENQNRFPYQNLAGEKKTMEHAAHQSRAVLQSFSYRLAPTQKLSFSSWYQADVREVQPSLFVNLFDELMHEKFWRNSLQYELNTPAQKLTLTGGYFYNLLPQIERHGEEQTAHEYVNNFQGKARYYRKLESQLYLRSSLEMMHSKAFAAAFNGSRVQDRLGLMAGLEYSPFTNFSIDALLRQEYASGGNNSGLLPSLALQYQLNPAWNLALNGSYNFRVLSLNEQYWARYSQRELLPEESRNLEFLVRQERQGDGLQWKQSLSLFSYWVDNWIVWVPGMPSWKPENATEVHNRGLEYTAHTGNKISEDWSWRLNASYNHTLATNLQEFRGNREAIGKQLIFTPPHKAAAQGQLHYKKWNLTLDELFTDKRFSRSDESEYLPAFWLTNLSLGYQHRFDQKLLAARLTAHNLFNYHYQVIPFYAMPGRIWELSLNYKLDL